MGKKKKTRNKGWNETQKLTQRIQSIFKRAEKRQKGTKDWIFVTMQKEKGARGFACTHVKILQFPLRSTY